MTPLKLSFSLNVVCVVFLIGLMSGCTGEKDVAESDTDADTRDQGERPEVNLSAADKVCDLLSAPINIQPIEGIRGREIVDSISTMLKTAQLSDAELLASTVCLEHITAIMGEWLLANGQVATLAPDVFCDLILWHAVEELEHKSVAFDVYMQCVGDRELLRRVMVFTSLSFCFGLLRLQCRLLWWERKLPSFRDIRGTFKFNFGKSGVIRHVLAPYLRFFSKDFHPNNSDESHLIRQWMRDYPELAEAVLK